MMKKILWLLLIISMGVKAQPLTNLLTQTKIGTTTTGLSAVTGVNTVTGITQPSGALQYLRVNAGNTALEFGALPSTGTVTSVAVTGANGIGVTGSPITSAGTIALSLGAITPTSVAASGTVTGSNLSGTNTGDQTITLIGDVSGSGTGTITVTIGAGVVGLASLQAIGSQIILGRNTAGTGNVEQLSASTTKTILSLNNVENTALSTWAGTTNITTLGTISTGTWNGSTVTVPYGGTGNTTFTAYSVLCAGTTATGAFQNVSGVGTSGQVLTSNGAAALPTWATPSAGTVTSFAATDGNGFDFSVANPTTTPTLTATTTVTTGHVMYSNSGAITGSANHFWDNANSRLGILTAAPSSSLDVHKDQNSVTQADANGISLMNLTAATVGLQSISPPLIIQGNGWKTTATAASQDVRFRMDVLPVQGTTNPTSTLQFGSSINAAAYTLPMTLKSHGLLTVTISDLTNNVSNQIGLTGFSNPYANPGGNITGYFGCVSTTDGGIVAGGYASSGGGGFPLLFDGYWTGTSAGASLGAVVFRSFKNNGANVRTGISNTELSFQFRNNATVLMTGLGGGQVAFGTSTTPTATVHIKAGGTAASSAPLKFTTGTSMTAAEAGAVEFTTDDLFFTITTGAARKRLLMADPVGGLTSTRVPFATTNGRLTDDADMTHDGTTLTLGATTNLKGTVTNNDAVAGNIGEEVVAIQSTYTNYTTTATYQNITSITLTAGDWDINAFFTYSSNAATITAASNAIFVISTTTASDAGATEGRNISYVPQAALLGTSKFSDAIPDYRVSITGSTTYYLNSQATFTLGNPQFVGGIRARRMR